MAGEGSIRVETPAVVGRVSTHRLTKEEFDAVVYILGETFGSLCVRPASDKRSIQIWSYHRNMNTDKMMRTLEQTLSKNKHLHKGYVAVDR